MSVAAAVEVFAFVVFGAAFAAAAAVVDVAVDIFRWAVVRVARLGGDLGITAARAIVCVCVCVWVGVSVFVGEKGS